MRKCIYPPANVGMHPGASALLKMQKNIIIFLFLIAPIIAQAQNWVLRDSVLMVQRSVMEIKAYEFADRPDIREVRFESGSRLKSIGEYAFLGCVNLKTIQLPESLVSLGEGCFRECNLMELRLPVNVTAVPKAMCAWNMNLALVKLPQNLTDIGSHSFAYCGNLKEITIPTAVAHIGSNAFSQCASLKEVVLPAGMKELESYAFSGCESLRSAVMPSNANLLGELIFSGCINLRSLTVMSQTPPPFDCNSFIFEPDETALYEACELHVPASSIEKYRRAPGWKLFPNID